MARDHELAPYDFWPLAESALGVGYDDVVLTIKEDTRYEEAWGATVQHGENVERRSNSSRDYDIKELEARGPDREAALKNLIEALTRHVVKRGWASMMDVLPNDIRRQCFQFAQFLLETQHTVVLGSKGSTVEEIANNIQSRKYHDRVQNHVKEIVGMVRDGDLSNEEDLTRHIDEIEVIYTSDAQNVLRHSDNDEAYYEMMGGEAPGWSALAACALQTDVREALPFKPHHIHDVDCPRCGEVVSTEDPRDEDTCPKCGIDLDTEVREGYVLPEPPNPSICVKCVEKIEDEEQRKGCKSILHGGNVEFDCVECKDHFLTAQAVLSDGSKVLKEGEDAFLCAACATKPDAIAGSPIEPKFTYVCCDCQQRFTTPNKDS